VSYNLPARSAIEDIGLLRYMLRHRHNTPFEMCEIKLHVKLPIFIASTFFFSATSPSEKSSPN
jgi:thymidylate synthase (FAD)